ncbi:hypothetical protein BH11ACT8_BH11ACT8_22560 [soil metagenome]
MVTVAKGLAGGFPIGACVALGAAGDLLQPGNHGTTFGGNPVACAAALAVIRTIEADGLMDNAAKRGEQLRNAMIAEAEVSDVTGEGLLVGAQLVGELAMQVVAAAQDAGFIVNATGPSRIRLAPPLVLTEDDVHAFAEAWPQILVRAQESP